MEKLRVSDLLTGKVAIVTGASRGIGRAIALELARVGAKVAVNYASSSGAADELVALIVGDGGEAISIGADVSKSEQIDALVSTVMDKWGRIDVLVNNAGIDRKSVV